MHRNARHQIQEETLTLGREGEEWLEDRDRDMVFAYERMIHIKQIWQNKMYLHKLSDRYVDIDLAFHRFLLCLKCSTI